MKKRKKMVELNDDQVEQVAGGRRRDDDGFGIDPEWLKMPKCPKCGKDNAAYIFATGKKREGSYFEWIDDKQYYCFHCGTYFWDFGKQDWETD